MTAEHTPPPLSARIVYEDPDYWSWCPSLVQAENGRWHLFASRWPKQIPFHPGWMLSSEIIRAEADRPEGPFTFAEVVMSARGATWWDGRSVHNPRVLRDGNRWVMFYMGSTHPFADPRPHEPLPLDDPRVITARWRKRIGVAVSDQLEGPWMRPDHPTLEVRPDKFDTWLTSNPAPCREKDGSWFLIYKTRATIGDLGNPLHGQMRLGVARAQDALGPWDRLDTAVFPADGIGEVEDPFVWRSRRGYELLFKDLSNHLTGHLHALVRAWSTDGGQWELDDPPTFSDRRVVWPDGREERLGSLERPSLLFLNGGEKEATHLVAAAMDGPGWFKGMTKSFIVVAEKQPPR